MPPAPHPLNEVERLAALHSYDVLDTACEAAFDNMARLAARLTDCPTALVTLLDADRQWFKARYGLDITSTPRDQAFCAHAILDPTGPMVVPDATQDARFADNPLVMGAPDIRFYAGMPLVNPEGYALGALCVIDYKPRAIGVETLDTLTGLAQAVTTTLELRRAIRQVRSIALTDSLTSLPNRAAFLDALGRAIARQRRDGQPFSLLYIDLDQFKQVNDRFGHGAGDNVLSAVGEALRSCMRHQDIVARIGGDEFGAILVGGDGSEAAVASERVRHAVRARMREGGWDVTASVGAAAFLAPPADADAALAAADGLMYGAKVAGKNRVLCRDFRAVEQPAAALPSSAVAADAAG